MKISGPPHRMRGFTLMELMVVIMIVAILAAVAYPNYTKSILRSNRSDARATLLQIAQNLERYFTENNTYVGATLGSAAATDVWSSTSSTAGNYTISFSVTPTATTYTVRATAVGRQAKDTACPNLTLTQQGAKAPAACW